ncbi:MAG: adenylate/guanylate cyclase domain-containing protein [Elusimicrobia bacterium]|nr:adenylate/guanylate cyclase domain-containing protein [Elusimicrobiota bacterium]
MKKNHTILGLIVSLVAILIVFLLWWTGTSDVWENKFFDYKFKVRGANDVSKNIVIIGIDDDSSAMFGRWPWPRSIISQGVKYLKSAGAKVIGADILFIESSQDKSQDTALNQALAYSKCVVGATVFDQIPENIVETIDGKIVYRETTKEVLTLPNKTFRKSFIATGFTNAYPNLSDGVLRLAALKRNFEDHTYYSFDMHLGAKYLGKTPEELKIPEAFLVNYHGPANTYTRYSFSLIYDNKFPKEWIKDKIVLIGSLSTGAFDHFTTPFETIFPGVEFHANVIDNVINNNYIREVHAFIVIAVTLLLTVFISQLVIRIKAVTGVFLYIFSLIAYFIFTYLLFSKFNLHLDFLKPALGMTASYIGIMGYRFRTEEKEKRWIKKTFSSYMSPQVIKELAENPDKLKLGGEKKFMTVFFSDIRGFTTISEKYPPEEVVSILNEYLSAMTEIVFKYEGTLDKFVGDEIMAFWNSPLQQEDHAMMAINCSFDMLDKLNQLQEKWKQEGKPIIDIGIGINSGEMIVGNMGSFQRMDYTVIGDNVNLGARIESLTRQYNTKMIISEFTYEIVKDKIDATHLGEVKVKGKTKPVNIYDVKRKLS